MDDSTASSVSGGGAGEASSVSESTSGSGVRRAWMCLARAVAVLSLVMKSIPTSSENVVEMERASRVRI